MYEPKYAATEAERRSGHRTFSYGEKGAHSEPVYPATPSSRYALQVVRYLTTSL